MSDEELPRWLSGTSRTNSKQSKGHENRLAQRLGGKRLAGSGNQKWSNRSRRAGTKAELGKLIKGVIDEDTYHGDIQTPTFHFEHKFTRAKQLGVKLEWISKVREGARRFRKDPGLIMTFQDASGAAEEEWVAMPIDVYERLMRKAEG